MGRKISESKVQGAMSSKYLSTINELRLNINELRLNLGNASEAFKVVADTGQDFVKLMASLNSGCKELSYAFFGTVMFGVEFQVKCDLTKSPKLSYSSYGSSPISRDEFWSELESHKGYDFSFKPDTLEFMEKYENITGHMYTYDVKSVAKSYQNILDLDVEKDRNDISMDAKEYVWKNISPQYYDQIFGYVECETVSKAEQIKVKKEEDLKKWTSFSAWKAWASDLFAKKEDAEQPHVSAEKVQEESAPDIHTQYQALADVYIVMAKHSCYAAATTYSTSTIPHLLNLCDTIFSMGTDLDDAIQELLNKNVPQINSLETGKNHPLATANGEEPQQALLGSTSQDDEL